MSILIDRHPTQKSKINRAFVPTTALAEAVKFDEEMMHVHLTDGRIINITAKHYGKNYRLSENRQFC